MVEDPLAFLDSLEQFGIKLGLGNIRALVEALGHPESAYASIHIAGTNGKGSVTAMVDSVLLAAGIRSARYTSPHMIDLTERFVVNGEPVEPDLLRQVLERIREVVSDLRMRAVLDVQPTFFEVVTAAAFEIFKRASVDVAVCEVGLGGRLDATNVLSPEVCAITSIARDHEQYLGHTLREIAIEKAGIIKPDVPVVVGDMDTESFDAIAEVANARGARVVGARDGVTLEEIVSSPGERPAFRLRTPTRDYGELRLALEGVHQIGNALVAVRVLEALEQRGWPLAADTVARGLAATRWPGRLEWRRFTDGRELLLDAAHNPAGAQTLATYLNERSLKIPMVFAMMRDKDAAGILRILTPVVSEIVITRASSARSAAPAALADLARALAPDLPCTVARSPADALAVAWQRDRSIVVAGSIFLLGDVVKELGGS